MDDMQARDKARIAPASCFGKPQFRAARWVTVAPDGRRK